MSLLSKLYDNRHNNNNDNNNNDDDVDDDDDDDNNGKLWSWSITYSCILVGLLFFSTADKQHLCRWSDKSKLNESWF